MRAGIFLPKQAERSETLSSDQKLNAFTQPRKPIASHGTSRCLIELDYGVYPTGCPVPVITSAYQFDDFVEIIRCFDGWVAEPALLLVMVVDGNVRVFEGVAREDAGDSLIGCDYTLLY